MKRGSRSTAEPFQFQQVPSKSSMKQPTFCAVYLQRKILLSVLYCSSGKMLPGSFGISNVLTGSRNDIVAAQRDMLFLSYDVCSMCSKEIKGVTIDRRCMVGHDDEEENL